MQKVQDSGRLLFQPARPRLRACLDVVRREMSGCEAWDALHRTGLIPSSWMDGSERRFDPVADTNLRISRAGEDDPAPTLCPPTAAACVAMASCDVAAVEEVERAALRVFDSTAAWRFQADKLAHQRPSVCVWELLPIGGVVRARRISMIQGNAVIALEAASLAVAEHDYPLFQKTETAIQNDNARIAALVEEATGLRIADADRIRWWTVARELGLAVPHALRRDHGLGKLPNALRARRFADLPDIEPDLMAVALAGFASAIHGSTCSIFAVRPAWTTLAELARG